MPDRDIEVNGTMKPKDYKLSFKVDGAKIPDQTVACDSEIENPAAPERHALTFAGWNDLPDAMPAHDVVVAGTYKPSDGIYVGVNSDFDGAEGDLPIEVDGKAENEALGQFKRAIVVSGGRIEVNGRKKQITRVDISPFVSDGVVIDREGLAGAIKNLYNATVTKKNDTFRLIVDHKASVNSIVRVDAGAETAEAVIREEVPAIVKESGLTDPKAAVSVLSLNDQVGKAEGLISLLDTEYANTFFDLLNEAGFVTDDPITPEYFLCEALKTKSAQRKGNSIIKFRSDGFMLTALVRNGRVVFSVKNKIPYDLNADNKVTTEIDTEFAAVAEHIREENDGQFQIRGLIYGGLYSEKKKAEEKYLRRKIKEYNKSQKKFFARTFTRSKPALYDLAVRVYAVGIDPILVSESVSFLNLVKDHS